MTPALSVVIQAGPGGRALLRTADSVAKQTAAPADLTLVKSAAFSSPPIADSLVVRLGAGMVEAGPNPAAALNAAVKIGRGRYLAVVPSGFELDPRFLERSAALLDRVREASALAPSVLLHTADRRGTVRWVADGISAPSVLADPRSVPPVFVVRRSAWDALDGFDESLAGLVEYEFWLRLALARHRIDRIEEPLVARELDGRAAADEAGVAAHLALFRAVLTRHRSAIAAGMVEVLVSGEVRFGRAREAHRDLVDRRDADLAELDRLRAEAAHHRAYLEHHGRTAVDWGDLRRVDPLSRDWGYDRGIPIDRRYIDEFLAAHSSDVRGAVLEVQEDDFTRAFGGSRVSESAVLDIDGSNPRATILADLRCAPEMPSGRFDCVILTQTLHVIDDMSAALRECHRILKPGGVLLATLPSASRVCLEYGEEGDLWRMTPAGARALFHAAFRPSRVSTDVFGSVLTNTAFLHGFAAHELTPDELDARDPYHPALIGVRARKSDLPAREAPRGAVLLYHRIDETTDVHELGVPPPLFDAHLQWLRTTCSVMPLDELLTAAPEQLPDRPVAITFDDGYVDCLREGAPLLQRYGVPAAFFLTSRWLNEPGEYWWDVLERTLLGKAEPPADLDLEIAGRRLHFATATREDRVTTHWQLHDALVHAALDDRDRAVRLLLAWCGGAAGRVRPMTADEVRELAALPGVTIGCHSVNHLSLPDQPAAVCRQEIDESRHALSQVIGRPVELFAYPYGALDSDVAALVRGTCSWGLSCDDRVLEDSFDAARVPRLDVKRWDVGELAARVERLFEGGGPYPRRALTRFL